MNFFFLDASALAKRSVVEVGTSLVDHLFNHAAIDRMILLNLGFAEVVSILVRRRNAGILTAGTFAARAVAARP